MMFLACSSGAALATGPCRTTIAPVLCRIKDQQHRTNTWRSKMGLPAISLTRSVYLHPHKRPYYLWIWQHRRIAARAAYRSLWAWVSQPAVWCVHIHESAHWDYIGAHDGGFQYLISTWLRAGGGRFASRAGYATPTEQIIVTRAYTNRYGWGEWSTASGCGL